MRPTRVVIALSLLTCFSATTGSHASRPVLAESCEPSVPQASGSSGALVAASNTFGFQLWSALLTNKPTDNLFLSPVSIALALDMTYDGARGTTRIEMSRALGISALSPAQVRHQAASLLSAIQSRDPAARLDVANSLWARKAVAFRKAFLNDARKEYAARVSRLDFDSPTAPAAINSWVSCATNSKIPSIVDRIPSNLILYLINAVYFEGEWSHPFLSKDTRKAAFTTGNGSSETVQLMNEEGQVPYVAGSNFQAISLPYSTGRFAMTVVLPKAGVSLSSFQKSMTPAHWNSWIARMNPAYGSIALPRFALTNTFVLNDALGSLGMRSAFGNGANFLGMCKKPCKISEVRHKTFLDVYEKGTTAAAVTSVGVVPTAIQNPHFRMTVDHPFIVAVRDTKTGTILFLGGINRP